MRFFILKGVFWFFGMICFNVLLNCFGFWGVINGVFFK